MEQPVILSAVRTPIGKFMGGLASLQATELGAKVIAEAGPKSDQAAKVSRAAMMTPGTNQPETVSARPWIGARERCASATI